MKKRSKTLLICLACIVFGFAVYYMSFLAPYNFEGIVKANSLGVLNTNSLRDISGLSDYFKSCTIREVKYLGNDSYEVLTDKGDFVVMADYTDDARWKYKIFRYDKEIQYFTNPM